MVGVFQRHQRPRIRKGKRAGVKSLLHFRMQVEKLQVLIDVAGPLSNKIGDLFYGCALFDECVVRFGAGQRIEIGPLEPASRV